MTHPSRRDFLSAAGAGALAACSPAIAIAQAASKRPNILVFLTDDHGAWAQHNAGNSELRTPNMDRLASGGTRMTRAFTPCPVCSPARACFFTGRMPSQHGIHDWIEEARYAYTHPGLAGQTLISELLKSSGYHTGLVGKWHCGHEREPQPGFDRWFSYWVNQYPHKGKQRFSDQGKEVNEEGDQSPLLTKRVIDFLRSHKQEQAAQPFFLVVGYVDTHSPYKDHPEELVEPYRKATFKDIPSEQFAPCHGANRSPVAQKPEIERERRAQYYGAVSSIDREVGKVLAELEASGQLENTLVIYTGDHGLNAGHHGFWNKGNATQPQNLIEESILIPCTLYWPAGGIAQGKTSDAMVDHCDMFATLLDIAGVSLDPAAKEKINSPGKSFLPILKGQPIADWRTTQFCEYGNARMIRTDRYKLIVRWPYKGVGFGNELYDLKDDPRETENRIDKPELAGVVKELTAQLEKFYAKYTVTSHDGLKLEEQPDCTPASPWIAAAKQKKKD